LDFTAINSPAAAFIAGLIASLHCAGMCGPLACVFLPQRGDREDARTVATIYHGSRLFAYALLGAIAGGLGRLPLASLSGSALGILPWLFVLVFIAMAFRWERHLPKIPGAAAVGLRLFGRSQKRSRLAAAATMGVATPLLPCGPLYFLVVLALVSGSALRGVEFMLAFGLGTVPLLWVAQDRFRWMRERLGPRWMEFTRIGLALCAAGVVVWRLRATWGMEGPDLASLICF